MQRTIHYLISEKENCFTVKQYLKTKGYSTRSLIELKKNPENVTVNASPVYMTRRLSPGDSLTVNIVDEEPSENILPVRLPLPIVYEDEDLLVIDKPAGMPIHPSVNNYDNSVANALAWYYREQGTPFVFRCINRLDRDTSGLAVIAKHYVSAGILSAMVAHKAEHFTREYLAVVRGSLTPPCGTISAPLARKPGSIIERIVDFEQGEPAITHYRLIQECSGHSLVSLVLETGRTHQIRIHMKYLGFPLVGDYLYNPDMEFIHRQALHSHRLAFSHPITGKPLEFVSPLPEDMKNVLREEKSEQEESGA